MLNDPTNNDLQLLTVKQAAAKLCCSVANVYALIESGSLAIVTVGKRKGYRIDLRDLDSFVQGRKIRYQVPQKLTSRTRFNLKHLKL